MSHRKATTDGAGWGKGGEDDPMYEVRKRAGSKVPAMIQANQVLEAVTEVIAHRTGKRMEPPVYSPVSYFAALMTFLDNEDDRETNVLAAVAYLLSVQVKKDQ